ncbi:MAG: response regulator [Paraburkholderia tropica]|uniref:Response regulator receiver domain-containing protein n=1 Tax=Paraburkholderia tropica TaxID=92647 RepID=A0AAQ1GN24_9BURK|nr:response regulator [Paraburkholderia tropica]RQN36232.1 response regulator [Paraburkholderia tropica]SEK14073.1 Response regulator receiver domain-containing protein [Paraburkholderia tropica]
MKTVVVVDDETLITDFLAFFLEDAGYIVHVAQNGVEALELVRKVSPDVVVTDYMMPLMTGLDLAVAMQSEPSTRGIPVILATAAQGAVARTNSHLFAAVLDKPYAARTLLVTIARLVPADG